MLTISQSKRFNEGSQEIKGREPGMQGREGDGLDLLVPFRSEGKKQEKRAPVTLRSLRNCT